MGEGVSNGFILEMEMKLLCCQSKGWLIQWLAIMCKLLIILPPFLHISEDHCLLQHPGFQLLGGYWFGAPGGSGFMSCHCHFFVKFQCLFQVIYHTLNTVECMLINSKEILFAPPPPPRLRMTARTPYRRCQTASSGCSIW